MSHRRLAILLAIVLFSNSPTARADDPLTDDAGLNDVFFVDAQCGWAVGDQGVIWHTEDGGQSWEVQPSGTVCSLRSVWFVDRRNGWVVGGQGLPYSAGSRGLVLATGDAGQSWQPLSWDQFPRLLRVQFLTAKTGWAWGEASDYYPSGLISSDSGGRLWTPASGTVGASWLAGFFTAPNNGVLAGTGGTTAMLIDRGVQPMSVGSLGGRSVRALKFGNDGTGWAVADGGVVMRSTNRGASWSVLSAGMPNESASIFDWRGVHSIASSVWVVGRPGSVILQSLDSGASWQPIATGQPLPLEAVWFHDRQRGWAVGAAGTILATLDGGRSWQVQRRGGERSAILCVHGAAKSAPLLVHVQLGAELGYRTADLAMTCAPTDPENSQNVATALRLADAIRTAGGIEGEAEWRFPTSLVAASLPQMLNEWNRQNEGHALQDLERRLAIAIRTWRPEVILAESPDPADVAEPSSALVSQVLERAFQSAANPAAFPELIESAQLEPWVTKKLYVITRDAAVAKTAINSSEISHRAGFWAGRPLDDQVNVAMSLLADSYCPTAPGLSLRCAISRLPAGKDDDSIMAGIVLEPGGPARRRLAAPAEVSEAQRRAVQARRNLLAIMSRAETQPILAQQMNAQVGNLVSDLPLDQAGNILYLLARTHFRRGRWLEARDMLEKLLAENPNHLTASEAQRWLIQYYASSEARHRDQVASFVGQSNMNSRPQRELPNLPSGPASNSPASASTPNAIRMSVDQQAGAVGGLVGTVPWSRGAVDCSKRLMQTAPLIWSEPQTQFALAAAQRAIGNNKDADKFYTTFAIGRSAGPWSDAARSELWIRDRKGIPPKPLVVTRRTPTPPRLDGVLDDPVWKATPAVSLNGLERGSGEHWETQMRVAFDQQFLYVAISCATPDDEVTPPVRPRARDMDLSAHDRVDLYLDLDRDYGTYYHLAADCRGCVFDDCWGDRTWDPTWYVASQADGHGYRIEAAIPLSELADRPPTDGTVWAFNAVRIVPGQRILSWSRPAGTDPHPEGMGLLLFSDGPAAPPPRPAVAN